jgi:hypothetical protein
MALRFYFDSQMLYKTSDRAYLIDGQALMRAEPYLRGVAQDIKEGQRTIRFQHPRLGV